MGGRMGDDLIELARRLRMARASVGMTQAEAASAALISQSALSLYEKAKREPHATSIKRLSVVYGVTMDWIMGLSDVMEPTDGPSMHG